MIVKTGIDIVDLRKFKESVTLGGEIFLDRLFSLAERENRSLESLAGYFAAKEAFIKATSEVFQNIKFKDLVVNKNRDGKPSIFYPESIKIESLDISISHDGNYAVASCLIILKNE